MTVYGYTRVSTEYQSEEGVSLEAQRRQLEGYAMQHNLDIENIYTDKAVSGWKPLETRPAGQELMDKVQAGDVILCPKLDRMFRNSNDALSVSEKLKNRQVSLHLLDLGGDVTENGVSKVFFTILAAFAEFERDRIAQRIRDAKQAQKADGKYLGGSVPFGYSIGSDRSLIPNKKELAIINQITKLKSKGMSLRSISTELQKKGVNLSHVTVNRIIRDSI